MELIEAHAFVGGIPSGPPHESDCPASFECPSAEREIHQCHHLQYQHARLLSDICFLNIAKPGVQPLKNLVMATDQWFWVRRTIELTQVHYMSEDMRECPWSIGSESFMGIHDI